MKSEINDITPTSINHLIGQRGVLNQIEVALDACRNLCAEINEVYDGRVTFHGHCEVSPKTCPVLDYKGLLILDRFGRMP